MGEEGPERKQEWYDRYDDVPAGKKVKGFIKNKEGQELQVLGQGREEIIIIKPIKDAPGNEKVEVKIGDEIKQCTFFNKGNMRFLAV